jgi:hypothetical protein
MTDRTQTQDTAPAGHRTQDTGCLGAGVSTRAACRRSRGGPPPRVGAMSAAVARAASRMLVMGRTATSVLRRQPAVTTATLRARSGAASCRKLPPMGFAAVSAAACCVAVQSSQCAAAGGGDDDALATAVRSGDAAAISAQLRQRLRTLSNRSASQLVDDGELELIPEVLRGAAVEPRLDALRLVGGVAQLGAAAKVCSSRCLPAVVQCIGAEMDSGVEGGKVQLQALRSLRMLALQEPAAVGAHSSPIVAKVEKCVGARALGCVEWWHLTAEHEFVRACACPCHTE